jgi:hypothetical protein
MTRAERLAALKKENKLRGRFTEERVGTEIARREELAKRTNFKIRKPKQKET